MEIRRCMKCMHELKPGETSCPKCGRAYGSWKAESFALKPGTILNGTYLVGEMLGQGGFGITYIGFDLLLEQKVAIKEYFPMSTGLVSRENQSTVVWSSAVLEKTGAERGFDSFLKEARKMAKLGGVPNVVGVKSVFIQNETAYIVMDFIEGETLLKKLQREGPMDFETCISLLTPIMKALARIHQHGIIHRDISPDNIMVQQDGTLMLLDLGAAKDLDIQKVDGTVQSSQLVAKQGFSPFEQYRKNAEIGPWTDVYAMAATIYYCCTGVLPPTAVDRMVDDTLICRPLLTKEQFEALAACMAILSENRPQNMDAMLEILTIGPEPEKEPVRPEPIKTEQTKLQPIKSELPKSELPQPPRYEPPKRKTTLPKWLIPAAVGIVVLCIGIGIGTNKKQNPTGENTVIQTAPTEMTISVTTVPETTAPEETIPIGIHVMDYYEDPTSRSNQQRYGEDPSSHPFWGQESYKRGDVQTVTFRSTLEGAPDSAWDVSWASDRSILAWMDGGDLYVATNGTIAAYPDASHMFAWFKNLRGIDFGDCFDTSNVTDMSCMFIDCKSLTELDMTSFDTENVTAMSLMFNGCESLTELDLSGFDTANVTDMSAMFSGCENLTSLDISDFNTEKLDDLGSFLIFDRCDNLTDLKCFNDRLLVEYNAR